MKTLVSAKKVITLMFGMGSVALLASVISDLNYNSDSFMQDNEIKIVKRFDDRNMERVVASAERELPHAQYLPVNDENKEKINGVWEITRILGENKDEELSVEKGDDPIEMSFEMIGTSFVRINNDEELDFDISFLHESGNTIALFRSFGPWYEIIEARRVVGPEIAEEDQDISSEEFKELIDDRGLVVDSMELVLERALFSSKNSNVLRGELVSGDLSLAENSIESLTATVGLGEEYETSISIKAVEIRDGGQFEYGEGSEMLSGIITRNGKEGYRVRFASGVLTGAVLNFVTEDEKQRIFDQEEEARLTAEENLTPEQMDEIDEQQNVETQRKSSAIEAIRTTPERESFETRNDFVEEDYDEEDYDADTQLSKEEVTTKVEEGGFEF